MSNSKLVDYTLISPNRNSPRDHVIDTITIHCVCGQLSVESLGNIFVKESRQASSNYGIGSDGRVGMYCPEADRSWCSSSRPNDQRAITIECASDKTKPYAINDIVYAKLIELCADIVERNPGFGGELKWRANKNLIGNTNLQNMTVHRWFANTSCPGEYLYNKMGTIASDVNALINKHKADGKIQNGNSPRPLPFLVKVPIKDLNIRKGPGTNYSTIGRCTGIGTFTIVDFADGEGSKNGWGKLKSGLGWISLDYVIIRG